MGVPKTCSEKKLFSGLVLLENNLEPLCLNKHQNWVSRCLLTFSEAATGGVLLEKVFIEISQNSQENIGVRVSF